MRQIAGAILTAVSLLVLILARLGHKYLWELRLQHGGGEVPNIFDHIPWHDMLLLYGAVALGIWLVIRRE